MQVMRSAFRAGAGVFLVCGMVSGLLAAARRPAARVDPFGGLTNASQRKYAAKIEVEYPPTVNKNASTTADDVMDDNAHTRCVFTGAPYTFTITLCDKLPIERIALAQSDYGTECKPKDVVIELDDGTKIQKTLEDKPSAKGKPAWQDVAVGKEARRVKVTVGTNYPGKNNWGGLADVAILTPTKLDDRFVIPNYDPAAPSFIHSVSPAANPPAVKVNLPPLAKPGEHPCLLMTKAELAELRQAVQGSERGKETLKALLDVAEGACQGDLDFPDPKGTPAQMTDRSDPLAKRHSRMANGCGTLGMAYAMTGDVRFARRAADILRGYAQRYGDYAEHRGVNRNDSGKVFAQKLSEAMWLIPQIIAYDNIYDSGALNDADKKSIEQNLFRAAVEFIRRKPCDVEASERDKSRANWRTTPLPPSRKSPVGNWLNFYNAATMLAGAVINDRNMVDLAAADFRELIQNGIGEDGMWGEGAIGYQLFATYAMTPGLEAAARRGIDLWGFENARVKFMFDSPLWYAYPDSTAPGVNDSGRVKFDTWQSMIYDYGYLRFGDPRYAALINRAPRQLICTEAVYVPTQIYSPLPEPKIVENPSMVFTNLGYAVMRGGDRYTLLKYGPHGGTHGHYDKLNLILFAGDELGGEPQFHRYEDPLHGQWTVQTVAHNTLTVDESRQNASGGKLLVFEDAPGLQVMRAEAATAYAGVLLDRTVVVTDSCVIDLYRGRSQLEHTWDRTFRFNGKLRGLASSAEGKALGKGNGYEHIKVAQKTAATDGWSGTWDTPGGALRVLLAGGKGQEVIAAIGPDDDQLALARQQGPQADFAAVYAMESWKPAVDSVRLLDSGSPNIAAAEVAQAAGTVTVLVAHASGPWSAAGWQSDARVLCIAKSGNSLRLLIGGGSFAKGAGTDLKFDVPGNYLAEGAPDVQVKSQWTNKP